MVVYLVPCGLVVLAVIAESERDDAVRPARC
jgi:hypothetical protein